MNATIKKDYPEGPFTLFAPTNATFDLLPVGTVKNLLKDENKATLAVILTYHVEAGRPGPGAGEIMKLIKAGNGTVKVKTVAGGNLSPGMNGEKLVNSDEKGGVAIVTIKNVNQRNGVIHVIGHVLISK